MSDDTPIGLPPPSYEQALALLHDAHVELLMLRRDKRDLKQLLNDALDALATWSDFPGEHDADQVAKAEAMIADFRKRLQEIE